MLDLDNLLTNCCANMSSESCSKHQQIFGPKVLDCLFKSSCADTSCWREQFCKESKEVLESSINCSKPSDTFCRLVAVLCLLYLYIYMMGNTPGYSSRLRNTWIILCQHVEGLLRHDTEKRSFSGATLEVTDPR